jgi:voltage-gated potassium channel
MVLIALNVICTILETDKEFSAQVSNYLDTIELVSIIVFTVEYILRLWTCTLEEKFKHPIWGRLKFVISPLSVIDLIVILPFYLPVVYPDLALARILRFLRILRLLKIARYSDSLKTLGNIFKSKKEDLSISFFSIIVLTLISSSLIYYAENDAQPEKFSSIPAAMWWSVITLTSVGYGDIYPITPLGKLMGGFIAILGVGLFALPTGIFASGYVEEIQKKKPQTARNVCPHCGESLNQ